MTLLPFTEWNVKRVDRPRYELADECSNPYCSNPREPGGHHISRRSHGTPDWWVEVEPYGILPNVCGLCSACHRDVTGDIGGHRAAIKWNAHLRQYEWLDATALAHDGETGPRLSPYPAEYSVEGHRINLSTGEMTSSTPTGGLAAFIAPSVPPSDGSCPTCRRPPGEVRQPKPKTELPPGEKRPKRTWAIHVPQDDREKGHALIEEYLGELAEVLGRGEHSSYKYYTMIDVFAWAIQNKEMLRADLSGEG